MKINVGVMFGGASVEHEISILTAMQAMEHMDKEKYECIPIYCSKSQNLYQDDCLMNLDVYKDLNQLTSTLTPVSMYTSHGVCKIRSTSRFFAKEKTIDFVVPIFHGTNGEDGTIQGFLKMLGVPFCGCDVLGGAIGQDKVVMKELLSFHQIPICPWFSIQRCAYDQERCLKECETLGFPVIIKPANLGSSIGIHIVKSKSVLDAAMQNAFLYDELVVVEKLISSMREFNCSVLGDQEEAQASCIEEVLKGDEILSYHDKYEGKAKSKGMANTNRVLPAILSEQQQNTIESLAISTFQVLRASGVVRIDFLMDEETQAIYVNEINTIPGSLSFYLWQPKGISFSDLIDRLIAQGIKRQRQKSQMIFSYTSNLLSSYHGGSKMLK